MQIKLSIKTLQSLTNNEALLFFSVLVALKNNPESTLKDIVRLSTFSESTVINNLDKFEKSGYISIFRSKSGNRYMYVEPKSQYVIIDSSLLDIDLDRNVLGFLIRLKCWTRISSNIIDLSLNRIVHEIGVQHNSVYAAMEAGVITREPDKKLYFTLVHPSLTIIY